MEVEAQHSRKAPRLQKPQEVLHPKHQRVRALRPEDRPLIAVALRRLVAALHEHVRKVRDLQQLEFALLRPVAAARMVRREALTEIVHRICRVRRIAKLFQRVHDLCAAP